MTRSIDEIRTDLKMVLKSPECHQARVLHWAENAKILLNELDLTSEALSNLLDLVMNYSSLEAFSNGVTDPTGTIDEGQVLAADIIEKALRRIL